MITKKPEIKNNFKKQIIFTKNARSAWKGIIDCIKGKDTTLLLPSYIGRNDKEGSGVFDAILFSNVNAVFYRLNNDLSVDIDDLEAKLETLKVDVVLVIHYFGFCRTDMVKIKNICNKNKALLVEDCAHAFNISTNLSVGNYGDFSFYSIHKYLPSFSGGILKINNVSYQEDIKNIAIDDINIDDLKIYAASDLASIFLKRKENYKIYQDFFSEKNYITSLYKLTDSDNPQTYPILVHDNLREKLYFHLIEKGIITIALYYRLIDEIDIYKYKNCKSISNNILNLPVHQDVTKEEINIICKEIHDYLSK
ncbi:TPA: DegT/DnrJ/EryC1/StrS aminotransferase family protein [Morganella morganii]|uniref:DegT/DnrJ/EryC1/StrS family aminotransferase n=1 Tax=Morganella morganii TaxID=582 RepID=UPI001BD9721D|nr:DegT/DnrJ/EryC1/StrS family aminotransferase [Morganella morganii]MBT0389326.1 DegT/DnrJ/EryC1/StrS aminotransferase family protein [Morganella morganii subsp. morganii]HEJ1051804.1 DegT/DnrJ/EryC1/StrS aminotransferase family protein [Morganella morganii]